MKAKIAEMIEKTKHQANIKTIQSLIDLCFDYDEITWCEAGDLYRLLEEKNKIFSVDEDQIDLL